MEKTLKQLDKASDLLYVLSWAIDRRWHLFDNMDKSWIESAKKLSREIDSHLEEITNYKRYNK